MTSLARAAMLYAVLALAMTWPLALHAGSSLPAGGDNLHLAWLLAWMAHAAAHCPADLFDGNIYYPAHHAAVFSDPNVSNALALAPLYYSGASPALLVNVLFLASFPLCGLCAFALARGVGLPERAAIAAGVFFAFSPLRLSHVDHVQLYAFWWTPLGLVFLDRYLRDGTRTYAWGAGVSFVLQVYASIYLAVFQAVAAALLLALSVASGRARVSSRRMVADLVSVAGAVLFLCAPLALAYYSVNRTWGVTRSLEQNVRYSASVAAFLSAAPNNVVWGGTLARFADPVAPWEKYLFPGLVPLGLAAIGLRDVRGFAVRYGLLLFGVGAVFALGPLSAGSGPLAGTRLPYSFVYEWLPPLRALRAPARVALLASLGLALVAAAGTARLRKPAWTAAIVLAAVEAWVWPLPIAAAPALGDPVHRHLAASAAGPVIELPLAADWEDQFRLEPPRLYRSTVDWRPLANGYSGFTPDTYRELARISSGGPSAALYRFLAAWRIRTLVLHLDEMNAALRDRWTEALRAAPLREGFRDRDAVVVELDVAAEPFTRARAVVDANAEVSPRRRQSLSVRLATDRDHPLPVRPDEIGWHTDAALWSGADGEATSGWARYYCPPAFDSDAPDPLLFVEPPSAPGTYRLDLAAACYDLSARVAVRTEPPS